MLSNIGMPGVILIILFALIVFGPKRLPELGKSMGKTLREFKSATKGIMGDDETVTPPVAGNATSSSVTEAFAPAVLTASTETSSDKV